MKLVAGVVLFDWSVALLPLKVMELVTDTPIIELRFIWSVYNALVTLKTTAPHTPLLFNLVATDVKVVKFEEPLPETSIVYVPTSPVCIFLIDVESSLG